MDSAERVGSVVQLRTALLSALRTDCRFVAAVVAAAGWSRRLGGMRYHQIKECGVLTPCCLLGLLLLTEQTCTGGSCSGSTEESSRRLSWLLLLGLLTKHPSSGSSSIGTKCPCGGLSKDRLVRGYGKRSQNEREEPHFQTYWYQTPRCQMHLSEVVGE